MKQLLHKVLANFGLRIQNRKKMFAYRSQYLTKYLVKKYKQVFLDSFEYIIKLENYFENLNFEDGSNGILVSINNFKFYAETKEEFFIICEVFVDKDYNFLTNKECEVIDIGCNIGLASIFFAQNELVNRIYSFEPVKETFAISQTNFSLNENLNQKISSFNYGLGNANRKEVFMFDPNIKGNTGSRGDKSISYQDSMNKKSIEVSIKDCAEILTEIFKNTTCKNFVVKMDCEGAEYEIMQHLNQHNLLPQIKIFMIEWHDEGAQVLEKILVENNFVIFSRNLAVNSGMIYAYNSVN